MNKVVYGVLAVSLVGNGYLLLNSDEKPQVEQPAKEVVVTEKEVITLEVEDEKLRDKYQQALAEIEKYKQQLAEQEHKTELSELLVNKLDEAEGEGTATGLSGTLDPDSEMIKEMKAETDRIKNAYKTESVDSSWASDTQSKISDALHEKGDLSLYDVTEIDCKASVCKMRIRPYSQSGGAGMAAGMNASFALDRIDGSTGLSTSFNVDSQTQEVDVYITQDSGDE